MRKIGLLEDTGITADSLFKRKGSILVWGIKHHVVDLSPLLIDGCLFRYGGLNESKVLAF